MAGDGGFGGKERPGRVRRLGHVAWSCELYTIVRRCKYVP